MSLENKKYRKLLKGNTKKRGIIRSLLSDEMICLIVMIAIILSAVIFNYTVLSKNFITNVDKTILLVERLMFSIMFLLVEAILLAFVFSVISSIIDLRFRISLLLNRRFLPLTADEIKRLPFETEAEFYDFLYNICGYKHPFDDKRTFVELVCEDVIEMIYVYNEIHGFLKDYIGKEFPKDLEEYIYSMDKWLLDHVNEED